MRVPGGGFDAAGASERSWSPDGATAALRAGHTKMEVLRAAEIRQAEIFQRELAIRVQAVLSPFISRLQSCYLTSASTWLRSPLLSGGSLDSLTYWQVGLFNCREFSVGPSSMVTAGWSTEA